jgi:hypothetical protein
MTENVSHLLAGSHNENVDQKIKDVNKRMEYQAFSYSLCRKINVLLRKSSENTADIESIDASTRNKRRKYILLDKHLRNNFALLTEFNWIMFGTMLTTQNYISYDREHARAELRYLDSVRGVNYLQRQLPPTVTFSDAEKNRLSRQIDRFKELGPLLEGNMNLIIRKIFGYDIPRFFIFWPRRFNGNHSVYVSVLSYIETFDMNKRDVREFLRKHRSVIDIFPEIKAPDSLTEIDDC